MKGNRKMALKMHLLLLKNSMKLLIVELGLVMSALYLLTLRESLVILLETKF